MDTKKKSKKQEITDQIAGDKVAGDKVAGDKIMGDKIEHHHHYNQTTSDDENRINSGSIELVSLEIDQTKCSWESHPEKDFSFWYKKQTGINDLLILRWTLLNKTNETIIFSKIRYKAELIRHNFSKTPGPSIIQSIVEYEVQVKFNVGIQKVFLPHQIKVPNQSELCFSTELYISHSRGGESKFPLTNVFDINFFLDFSGNITVPVPTVHINSLKGKKT